MISLDLLFIVLTFGQVTAGHLETKVEQVIYFKEAKNVHIDHASLAFTDDCQPVTSTIFQPDPSLCQNQDHLLTVTSTIYQPDSSLCQNQDLLQTVTSTIYQLVPDHSQKETHTIYLPETASCLEPEPCQNVMLTTIYETVFENSLGVPRAVTSTVYETVKEISSITIDNIIIETVTRTIAGGHCQSGYVWDSFDKSCVANFGVPQTVTVTDYSTVFTTMHHTETRTMVHTLQINPCQPGFNWDNFISQCVPVFENNYDP